MPSRPGGRSRARVHVVEDGVARLRSDSLATEEPLEIRIQVGSKTFPLAVTMRTPGADFDLVAGFLFAEKVVSQYSDIKGLSYCIDNDVDPEQRFNIVNAALREGLTVDLRRLERHFFTTSACGVCGKASLDQLEITGHGPLPPGPRVTPALLQSLPDRLREGQALFEETGGLHAAGLFNTEGELLALREDVGRHNALDKLIGWAMLNGHLPLSDKIIMVSGRSSFEIMQKCLTAGAPIVCAVSAPSSLAVDVAKRFGMTLVGFLRGQRFNLYCGEERINLE
jgi:FdhD protein